MDAEVGYHGLAVAVADGGDDLLVLGAGELVEEDAVGRLVDAEALTSLTMSAMACWTFVGAAEGVVEVAAGEARAVRVALARYPRRAPGSSRRMTAPTTVLRTVSSMPRYVQTLSARVGAS